MKGETGSLLALISRKGEMKAHFGGRINGENKAKMKLVRTPQAEVCPTIAVYKLGENSMSSVVPK